MDLFKFEISKINHIIRETEILLNLVGDSSSNEKYIELISNWIEIIKNNKFNSLDKKIFDDFFDSCINQLESKKSILNNKISLTVPFEIERRTIDSISVSKIVSDIEEHMNSKDELYDYLESLNKGKLLIILSLIYIGRDGSVSEYREDEFYFHFDEVCWPVNLYKMVGDKVLEIEKNFKDKQILIQQIKQKFDVIQRYLLTAKFELAKYDEYF